MGVAEHLDIHGSKGGESKPKSPIEAADSLRSTNLAKILIAVGEGEFDGVPTAADIYLDNTPINDASGNVNFPNVKWEWRSGSVEQDYIPGIPSVENETTVNVELRSDSPWVRSVTNTQLSAARVRLAWPVLQQQDDNGNVGGYRIEYAIDVATDGGAYQQVLIEAVDGKTTTRYERSRRIDLPSATSGWQIRVRRLTPNQNTNKIADTMIIAGLTEVIDEKLRYPNTALLFVEFDAEQFSNIPAVTVDCNARKWQVPSNYDPVARTYGGVWDGTFKQAWTNNPAWITFGICTVDRFGLGKRIKPFMVDKWELYRIAQYCDQLVPNGIGGQEPRFLCDMNLQGKAEAWTLLRDISAIYRGMTYWAQGQLAMQADMPRAQDFDYVFTRANVIDGAFDYGSASAKTRYTRAIVSYDNPANNYDTDVTAFSDLTLQRRFGDTPVEISAIGCTRASEAQRRGKWAVLSNNQDRTVTFKTGMEGAIPLPGFIIPIADSLLAGREIGGRISIAAGRVVTLDRDTLAKAGDRLIINLPSGKAEGRTVQSVAGRALTVTTAYSETPSPQLQWALDADDLAIPLYRVLSTKRTAEGEYEISALQYEPSKFAYIDTGARLEERPISVIPITVVPAPASVTITATSAVDQGISVSTMTITWPAVNGAVGYDVEWRKDSGNWIRVQRTGTTSVDITGIYSGAYLARVRAVSAYDISSIWRTSNLTQLNGKEGLPPAVTSLTTESLIFGIGLKWTFPPGAEDTQRTEIWYSETPQLDRATKLADLAYPQSDYTMMGLRAGQQFFFWARLVDRTGNVGPWFPADGTVIVGQASADADDILDYLVGEITESQLGQELLGEIGKIGGDGPGSVNERLDEVRGELADVQTSLGEQITGVNNTVSEVQSELQAQIDHIADLADSMPYKGDETYTAGQGVLGDDGIIYQATQDVPVNTPPPNATYWLNVGQAVQTANGLAARVTTAETKITSIEGVNTAQANQITGLQTSLDGKADSSVVSSLSSRVTTAENTLSSQGTAITGLNNSLNTTNTNVTAAQNAANAANTLAGGKGKVIVQSAAPAAADQLAQNLWIDITNNANTPKRWTGSAWAAVTDKAATDAAAAAASALAQVATKAEASTVQALSNTVTQQGSDLTAAGNAITTINASLSQLGASGTNLLPAEMSVFGATVPDMTANGGATKVTTADASALKGYALSTSWTTASGQALLLAKDFTLASCNMSFKRQKYIVSFWAKASVDGHQVGCYLRTFLADNATTLTSAAPLFTLTTDWVRYSAVIDATGSGFTGNRMAMVLQQNRAGVAGRTVWFDRIMLESAVGSVTEPSTFAIGNSFDQVTGQATATTALTARVTQTETSITSVSGQLTQLSNSIGGVGGQNLAYNPSFERPGSAGLAEGWYVRNGSGVTSDNSLVDSTLATGEKAQRLTISGISASAWFALGSDATHRAPILGGGYVTVSFYVKAPAGVPYRPEWWAARADGTNSATGITANTVGNGSWQRVSVTFSAPSDAVHCIPFIVVYGTGSITSAVVEVDRCQVELGSVLSGWKDNNGALAAEQSATSTAVQALQSTATQQGTTLTSIGTRTTALENTVNSTSSGLATKASASAVDTLTNRVTAAEGSISSTSGAVTQLQNSIGAIGGAGTNLLPSEYTTFTASTAPATSPQNGLAMSTVALATATGGYLLKASASTAITGYFFLGTSNSDFNIRAKPNGKYLFSFSAYGSAAHNLSIRVRYNNASGTAVEVELASQAITTTLARYSLLLTMPAGLVDRCVVLFYSQRTAATGDTFFDGLMLENQIGTGTSASDFVPGYAARQSAATASALGALTSTVTSQGNDITSASSRVTSLENSVNSTTTGLATKASNTALSSLQSTVTQQGNTLTSQGTSLTGLQSTVGSHTAQLQQQATTIADSAGKIAAAYSVRLNLSQNGLMYVAGFGVSLSNESGTTQSQFVVAADRFAVVTDVAGNVTSPFIIENGQAFIADAVIKKATITNAIVGQYLRSQAKTTSGDDIMTVDFVSGQVTTRHSTKANTYAQQNSSGVAVVVDGVLRVRMGTW